MATQTMTQDNQPPSGSDQDGPIWGYHFVPNQPAQSITSEKAVKFLTAPGPAAPDEFLWLHFWLSIVSSEPWLRRYWTLPVTFSERFKSDLDPTNWNKKQTQLVEGINVVLLDFTLKAPFATPPF